MRLFLVSAVLLIATSKMVEPMMQGSAQALKVDTPKPVTLDSFRDRYRPLLVFARTDKDERFVAQAKLLADGAASLHERRVVFVPLIATGKVDQLGVGSAESAELSPEDSAKARRKFHIAPDEFAVILVGKDGGEKFRAHTPVTIGRLNTVIDAMPMRQEELRNGNSK